MRLKGNHPMRYMMLIYTQERENGLTPEQHQELTSAHRAVMQETRRKGILVGAEPLGTTHTATTVRMQNGKALITDGPFAETKEQLAGYYILECQNLDEAIEWAARIPTACKGGAGCIEIRTMPGLPSNYAAESEESLAPSLNP
jgi:hypothetical protein